MEENKKGSTLYVVLGVATLVVAIIGATFAYFSAQATNGGDQITGGTNDDLSTALAINVERVLFGTTDEAGTHKNLVPAEITVDADGIARAVNNKCIAGGYTGCHLYKITASSTQTLAEANILLQSFKTEGVTDTESWKFVVFTGSETTSGEPATTTYEVSSIITGSTAENFKKSDAIANPSTDANVGYNINKDVDTGKKLGLTADVTKTYYLLVYLANRDDVQNDSEGHATTSAIGTYSGSVVLNAAGGKVVANFNTTTPVGE